MRTRLLFLALFGLGLLAGPLAAAEGAGRKVHYINKGVRYHIGDNRFDRSEDSHFMDAFPTVGTEWIQPFKVSAPDTVMVRIDNVWGADDCPYCRNLVAIDNRDMGRITAENNRTPFETLEPLAMQVVPGRTYYLRITSYGIRGEYDDFVIEGVRVETDHSAVTFLEGPIIKMPDMPMPPTEPPKGPCEGTRPAGSWMPGEFKSQGFLNLGEGKPTGDEKQAAAALSQGEFMQIWVKLNQVGQGDRVGQSLELVLGQDQNGWVISFDPLTGAPSHGNLKLAGRYSAPSFPTQAWRPSDLNDLRLARCGDGKARLFVNGRQMGQVLDLGPGPAQVTLKAMGLSARMSEKRF